MAINTRAQAEMQRALDGALTAESYGKCGDKHFVADVRCARPAGHGGFHKADRGSETMHWVGPQVPILEAPNAEPVPATICEICDGKTAAVARPWDGYVCETCLPPASGDAAYLTMFSRLKVIRGLEPQCEARTFCSGRKMRCDCAVGHVGYHESGTGISAMRWDGTPVKGTDRASRAYEDAALLVNQMKVTLDGKVAVAQPKSVCKFVRDEIEKGGYELRVGECFTYPAVLCSKCTSIATHGLHCAYCAHSTGEGQYSPEEVDRCRAGAMRNEEAHPGIVGASARNYAALIAERPKPTKSSRAAALPHPWENGFSSASWEDT